MLIYNDNDTNGLEREVLYLVDSFTFLKILNEAIENKLKIRFSLAYNIVSYVLEVFEKNKVKTYLIFIDFLFRSAEDIDLNYFKNEIYDLADYIKRNSKKEWKKYYDNEVNENPESTEEVSRALIQIRNEFLGGKEDQKEDIDRVQEVISKFIEKINKKLDIIREKE